MKRLFDNNFHQWKVLPLYLICHYLGKNFKFQSNLEVSHSIVCKFPKVCKEIFIRYYLSSPTTLPPTVACNKSLVTEAFICIISQTRI